MAQVNTLPERPLLSLAIPTYNRAKYLDQLLGVLRQQLQGESRVELIVSDNASTDSTPAVVEMYREQGLEVHYICNEMNIGPDANFLQCLEYARGRYLWLFGDDDIIVPGGIQKILSLLAVGDYGLVYINPYAFRSNYIAERTPDKFGRYAEKLSDGMQLVQRVGPMITFMSAMIINKDYYSTVPRRPPADFVGTSLIQLGWICPILVNSSNFLIVWERLVAGRRDNCRGWGPCQVFGVNLRRIANIMLWERKDIASELCNSTLQVWFPNTIIEIRRGTGSVLDAENIREVLEPVYKTNWRYWTYVYPIVMLPLWLANMWCAGISFSNRVRWAFMTTSNFVFARRGLVKAPK